ncbi:complement factor B, partial [Camarhynchus parvulus]|uniref:complement factor B n=1 Tax=Geospiza parvula TaxID=87175 RepID=UPI001237B64E
NPGGLPGVPEATSKRRIRLDGAGALNVFLVLDASRSVNARDYESARDALGELVEKIASFGAVPHYGVVTFGSEPRVVLSPTEPSASDAAAVRERLKGMSLEGRANMGGSPVPVLQQIRELLSIGRDPRDPREEFLDVYTFGLGEDHDKILLNELASKKAGETHTFSLRDTEDLQEVFHRMIDESSTLGLCGVSLEHNAAGDRERNPWEATVTVTRPGRGQERCQGSLVSPYFVLTAAHCFRSEDEPTWLGVDIGSREHRGVRGLFLHPEFSPGSRRNRGVPEFYDFDVALVQLDRKVQPSSTHRPICIPTGQKGKHRAPGPPRTPRRGPCQDHRRLLLPPKNVEAFFLHPRGSAGLQRQRVLLKLGDQRGPCEADALRAPPYANVTSLDDVVTPRFLCSGGHEPQVDPNACPGDSGGPVVVTWGKRHFQVGVVSWGVVSAVPERPRAHLGTPRVPVTTGASPR